VHQVNPNTPIKPLSKVPRQDIVVEHFDSPLRFMVRSRSQSGVSYLVDLGDDEFPLGSCHCKHHVCVCGPAQKRGERKWCQHVEMARQAFTDWAIAAFKRQDRNVSHDTQP
jgi:hypothetical protein